jgi:hypothetical protein
MSEKRISDMENMAAQGMPERGRADISELDGNSGHTFPKSEVLICEIITFRPLRERGRVPIYPASTGASALVLEFPVPRWQRNASARR